MGTPIRLVRNDGGIIELMATTLTMNVDRGVTPFSMPFAGGSRFAFDLNLPKALITIEGVMTDDDLLNIGNLERAASSVIDFSVIAGNPISDFGWADNEPNEIAVDITLNNVGTSEHAIDITTSGGVLRQVYFAKQDATFEGLHGGSGRYFVAVHDGTSARTAAQIAASLTTLINTYTGIFNLSANQINSPINGTTNTAVEITQTVAGTSGNTSYPAFSTYPSTNSNANSRILKPYHVQFSGGRNSSAVSNKSAGDKVAELFAVLNNSNNGGGGAATIGVGMGALAIGTGAGALGAALGTTAIGAGMILKDGKYGDYIIGIQIPFSSNVNNRESLFYMPTGGLMDKTQKTADNAPATGVEFDAYDSEFTGIKGFVANATFVQLGGEPLYSYTINFAPIDWIF